MSRKKITITWLGHSAFHIVCPDGKGILIDPWLSNPKAPPNAQKITPIDLILVSHGHSDHIGETVELARATGAKVVGIHEVSLYLRSQGISTAVGMNKGGSMNIERTTVT